MFVYCLTGCLSLSPAPSRPSCFVLRFPASWLHVLFYFCFHSFFVCTSYFHFLFVSKSLLFLLLFSLFVSSSILFLPSSFLSLPCPVSSAFSPYSLPLISLSPLYLPFSFCPSFMYLPALLLPFSPFLFLSPVSSLAGCPFSLSPLSVLLGLGESVV